MVFWGRIELFRCRNSPQSIMKLEMIKRIEKTIGRMHRKKLLFLLPVIFIIPCILSFLGREYTLFPMKSEQMIIGYSDSSKFDGDNGNSVVSMLNVSKNAVEFEYQLGEKYLSAYAGFVVTFSKDSTHIDLSSFDYLDINIVPGTAEYMRFFLRTSVPGFTQKDKPMTYRYLLKEITLVRHKHNYRVYFSEFKTPLWWYGYNKKSESLIKKDNFKSIIDIKIESGEITPLNKSQSLILKSVTAKKNKLLLLFIWLFGSLAYYLMYWIVLKFFGKPSDPVVIPYKYLNVESHGTIEERKIVEIIASDYKKTNLTIGDISMKTGVSTVKISATLQDKYSTTFKQYLNTIRLTEAKRLLKETDRQISEIAYMVGYKSVTHFNRVFKSKEKLTPKQFRNS